MWEECAPAGEDLYLKRQDPRPTLPDDLLCTDIRVPVDHGDPSGGRGDIDVAVVKVPAGGASRGALWVNPGGPGASGWSFAALNADQLREAFPGWDILGFDPRGVERSAPFTCGWTDAESVVFSEVDFTPESQAEYEALLDTEAQVFEDCTKSYPNWGFLGTESVAADLVVMNDALTDAPLNYYGVSYGSVLGYALLRNHASNVGKVVLESPVDPPAWYQLDHAAKSDARIDELVRECAQTVSCGGGRNYRQVKKAVIQAITKVESDPARSYSPDRTPSEGIVWTGMTAPFYSDWEAPYKKRMTRQYLRVLGMLIRGKPWGFEYWGYFNSGWDPVRRKALSSESVLGLVQCLDAEIDDASALGEMYRRNFREAAAANTYSAALLPSDVSFYGEEYNQPCDFSAAAWADDEIPDPVRGVPPQPVNPDGVPTLVLGVVDDAVTPFEQAESVAHALQAPLIEQAGNLHGQYPFRPSACVRDRVTQFLDNGTLPQSTVVCELAPPAQ